MGLFFCYFFTVVLYFLTLASLSFVGWFLFAMLVYSQSRIYSTDLIPQPSSTLTNLASVSRAHSFLLENYGIIL